MANRRPQTGGRRMDFSRNDRSKNFGRPGVSPWQGGVPGAGLTNLLPLGGSSAEATLALANNLINLLQPRQNAVPSLLDMPIRRDFGPELGRFDRSFGGNRMGNQGNYRRTGYVRPGDRSGGNRKPFKPNDQRPNRSSQKKEADPKPKTAKESDQDQKEPETEKPDEKKEPGTTQYDDIDSQLLKCHICHMSMWDGRSFENHLSGRAHNIMMQKVAESYALTADTMRQEIKIQEMKRNRKSGGHQQQSCDFYCTMCDMYAADGAVHRTTVGHRKLKKYLHPACVVCHKEMPNRLELDVHRLTAEHMRNQQSKSDVQTKQRPEGWYKWNEGSLSVGSMDPLGFSNNRVFVISTLEMEQRYVHQDRGRRRRSTEQKQDKEEKEDDKEQENQEEVAVKKEPVNADDQQAEEKKSEPIDKETTILDYKEGDDVSNATRAMFPVYSTERGVGKSFLSELRCFQCKLCHKLLDCEETAEMHLRTWKHHQLFVRLLADKSNQRKNQDAGKRPIKIEESGNWKRRKTSPEHEDDGDSRDVDHQNGDGADDDTLEKEREEMARAGENMPSEAMEAMEDWEQSVDEILEDESKDPDVQDGEQNNEEHQPVEDEAESAKEDEKEEKVPEPPKQAERKTRSMGRARRGRY